MNRILRPSLLALAIALPGCAGVPQQAADPAILAEIAAACTESGLFKLADGVLTVAVPAATLPVAVVNAGVDKVCANPTRFAADVSTAEWVVKNLAHFKVTAQNPGTAKG